MTANKKPRPRTYARNRAFSRRGHEKIYETDSWYFLKLVTVLLVGTFWLKFQTPLILAGLVPINGLPVGLLIGVILVSKFEPLQMNRRIWYAILVVATVVTYFLPAGVVI